MLRTTGKHWSAGFFAVGMVALTVVAAVLIGRSFLPRPDAQDIVDGFTGQLPFFQQFFKSYTPRAVCMHYEPTVIWLHLVSDLFIAVAYYSIPVGLVYFIWRRRDIAFHWMFWMFALFILACGTTHLIGVWALWQPLYKFDGVVKAATAVLSIGTAIALWPLIPKAIALPSPAQLEGIIAQRTAQLEETNRTLRGEIEARKQAEREREELLQRERAARSEAERVSRVKDEFLATVSHELRTPLNAILGWSHLLRTSPGDQPQLLEGLAVIERNARAQTVLIEDLLDMSRIVSGKMRLDVQPVALPEVVQGAIDSITPAAAARQIRLEVMLDPKCPPVTGDPSRLQQVVWNLLTNAVKFTPRGGRVQVVLERVNSQIEIKVADNGIGITPEFMPHVFERFQQADSSSTRSHRGLGIGLAIVRSSIELHGGSVRAFSAGEGRGATFTIILPPRLVSDLEREEPAGDRGNGVTSGEAAQIPGSLATLPAAAAPARAHPTAIPLRRRDEPIGPVLRGVRALVVDDDPDARDVLRKILEQAGAAVLVAGGAADAFDLLRNERPEILLCDIGLPGEDGYELLRRVRQLTREHGGATPAVAVTAFARPDDRVNAMRAGFQSHIAKPFEPAELVAAAASLLGRSL